MRGNGRLINTTKINPTYILLNEKRQTQKTTYCIIHLWLSEKGQIGRMENRSVFARNWRLVEELTTKEQMREFLRVIEKSFYILTVITLFWTLIRTHRTVHKEKCTVLINQSIKKKIYSQMGRGYKLAVPKEEI